MYYLIYNIIIIIIIIYSVIFYFVDQSHSVFAFGLQVGCSTGISFWKINFEGNRTSVCTVLLQNASELLQPVPCQRLDPAGTGSQLCACTCALCCCRCFLCQTAGAGVRLCLRPRRSGLLGCCVRGQPERVCPSRYP
jgi:hypothetical protein